MTLRKLVCSLAIALAVGAAPAIATGDPWPGIRADYREGRFDQALSSLKALLAERPDDRLALYYTAIIHWRLEDYAAAGASYRRLLALDPEGPFGQDARSWLAAHGARAVPSPTPSPTPSPRPTPRAAQPSPESARPSAAPRIQPPPLPPGRRPRSAQPRPGYFKVADGSFEFVPPVGFVLWDERTQGSELSALFGPSGAAAASPPTLLITWREFGELAALQPDQRAARERQLLAMEASLYGPGAQQEARYGGPCYRVRQAQGEWAAETLLFFQHGRLYAFTYGGAAAQLPRFRPAIERSWQTPIFYR